MKQWKTWKGTVMILIIIAEEVAGLDLVLRVEIFEKRVKKLEKVEQTAGERRYCPHDVLAPPLPLLLLTTCKRASGNILDANTIIQNFIKSMPGGQPSAQEKLFTTLADLLTPASTLPLVDSADSTTVDRLLEFLPSNLVALAQEADDLTFSESMTQSSETSHQPADLEKKKDVLTRVLRSPQFSQSLSSLTVALRDGGLPSISEALNIPVRNGGFMRRGGVPLGGGDAVEAFLDGVKEYVANGENDSKENELNMDQSQTGP